MLINGLGQFLGNFLVGALRDWTRDDYPRVFLPAAIGIAVLASSSSLRFRPPRGRNALATAVP